MKAVVQERYGRADVLDVRAVARPDVGDNEVLVQVMAAGVDRGALHLMTGRPYLMRLRTGLRAPRVTVPGVSFAGRVVVTGTNVTRFEPGDEVYGSARRGYAEFVAVAEDKVAPKPQELSFEEAATVPYAAFAALEALRVHAKVLPGEHVLVVGASGAVGSVAVQLAKAFGAEVTGVCGPRSLEVARSAGADHVVDYTREDSTTGFRRYDVIVDVFGRTRPIGICGPPRRQSQGEINERTPAFALDPRATDGSYAAGVLPTGYEIRPLTIDDAPALTEAYARSRDHLAPWEPLRTPFTRLGAGRQEGLQV